MLARLLLLFIAVPVLEILLILRVGNRIGVWATGFCMLATAVLGAWLARSQGLQVLTAIQTEMKAGRVPGKPLVEGVLILLAGAVLLTPGFLTDAVGFALLVPPIRGLLADWFLRGIQSGRIHVYGHRAPDMHAGTGQQSHGPVSGEVKGSWRVDSEEN